ncbi:hypothetical protein C2G38_2038638 [Gigaspora rosea]|uniref:DDE-1 domain-containing protein n=1 Tax=Gigaspora rosea TaxID=44941 RepID=A0A397V1R9_9GLOM|nr:hypothetical protein C2G38_2038638 [Gigaspora rosea]
MQQSDNFLQKNQEPLSLNNLDEEISDDNLEPEVTPVLHGNRQGRGRPRNKLNIKDAIYYVSECWNDIENSVIVNCWRKTGILVPISREEIEVATDRQNISLEQQEQDIDMLVIDLTVQDPDLEIKNQLNTYLNLNDLHIETEEKLEDSEIVEIILDEAN